VCLDWTNEQLDSSFPELSAVLPVDSLVREWLIYFVFNIIFGYLLYFLCSGGSYLFFFVLFRDRYNPTYKFNAAASAEIKREISQACFAVPAMAVMTPHLWMMDARLTYKRIDEYGYAYLLFSLVWFIMFTDFGIYWAHRWLHHPIIYPYLHKRHHSFIQITPFASHAFNPLDAWIQALPYHIFCTLFPFNNWLLLFMFIFVNCWTVSIHDRIQMVDDGIINGAQHHYIHHTHFVYNYGQYLTLWDRIGGSFLNPKDAVRVKPPMFHSEEIKAHEQALAKLKEE